MSQYPASTVDLYNVGGEGQVGIPYRDLPVGPVLQGEPLQGGRSRRAAARLERDVHDAGRLDGAVGLRHRPQDRHDPDRRQERQGRDRGRLRPREHRPVGLRAAARRPPPDRRVLEGRLVRRRRRQDRPDPRRLGRRLDVFLRWHLEGPHQRDRAAVPEHRLQPERLPVLHRQGRDERRTTCGRRTASADAGDDWNLAATPSYQGQTTAAFNADTFRILKGSKHPDEAFTVLPVPARQRATCSSSTAGCRPSSPSRTPSCRASRPTTRSRSTGTSPRRASSSPTSRTSSRTCRPTTRPST